MKFKPSVQHKRDLFSLQHVTKNIVFAEDRSQCPVVILLLSPGRSGSTAFLFAFARLMPAYFQPIKNILQFGEPTLCLPAKPFVFIKEVFGFWHEPECRMDAVRILLDAGLPPSKLRVVCVLRDPLATYDSWLEHFQGVSLETFFWSYFNVLHQERVALELGIKTITVAYETLAEKPEEKFVAILKRLKVPFDRSTLNWDAENATVEHRIILPPEADDPLFKELFLNKVRGHNEFRVTRRDLQMLTVHDAQVLEDRLSPIYRDFAARALFCESSIIQ